ncbi:MAG: TIM barrel protein [Actinomycetota bacterium]|nr:TIM barrel protein [Actinomycetota bacterium]
MSLAVRWPQYRSHIGATLDTRSFDDLSGLAGHHPMGVSTGIFKQERGAWPQLVAQASGISTYVVELSALSGDELPGLLAYLRGQPRLPFRYVSVHAPAKDFDEQTVVGQLAELPFEVRAIVVHPDAMLDPGSYRTLGTRLVIENMDDRKHAGRTVDELQPVFDDLPDAGFCFDVAHAWSVDPSMQLAHELLDQFRTRLRHVHLSSLGSDGHHIPLRAEDEQLFGEVLQRCRDVPWVLEARPLAEWTAHR